MNKEPSPFYDEFNYFKVVIFMEQKPCTDKFEQIMFTEENYFKVLNFMKTLMPKDKEDPNTFIVTTDDKKNHKFPEIKEYFTPEEMSDSLQS
jgi:hypothetical protein